MESMTLLADVTTNFALDYYHRQLVATYGEPLDKAGLVRQLGRQHLQRDRTVERRLVGAIDHAEATAADLVDHLVALELRPWQCHSLAHRLYLLSI